MLNTTYILISGLLVGILGLGYIYSPFFDNGADGLNGFLYLVIFALLVIGCALGLMLVVVSRFASPRVKNYLPFFALCIPVLVLISAFVYGNVLSRQDQYWGQEQTEKWLSKSNVITHTSDALGVTFTYVDTDLHFIEGGEFSRLEVKEQDTELMLLGVSNGNLYGRLALLQDQSTEQAEVFLTKHVQSISPNCRIEPLTEHPFTNMEENIVVYQLSAEIESDMYGCRDEYLTNAPVFSKVVYTFGEDKAGEIKPYDYKESETTSFAYQRMGDVYFISYPDTTNFLVVSGGDGLLGTLEDPSSSGSRSWLNSLRFNVQ